MVLFYGMDFKSGSRKLVVEDRLNFDIYHGTSSYFLNSIKKNGFGYKDPKLFDRNLLMKLRNEVERYLDRELIIKIRSGVIKEKNVDKKTLDFHFNCEHLIYIVNKMIDNSGRFSYDNMHFSVSPFTAEKYAKDGSEYLNTFRLLVNMLNKVDKGKGDESIKNNQQLINYFKTPHEPMLVIWKNPLLSDLGTEYGLSLEDVKNLLKKMTKISIFPTFEENLIVLQQCIFLSKKILPYKEINLKMLQN